MIRRIGMAALVALLSALPVTSDAQQIPRGSICNFGGVRDDQCPVGQMPGPWMGTIVEVMDGPVSPPYVIPECRTKETGQILIRPAFSDERGTWVDTRLVTGCGDRSGWTRERVAAEETARRNREWPQTLEPGEGASLAVQVRAQAGECPEVRAKYLSAPDRVATWRLVCGAVSGAPTGPQYRMLMYQQGPRITRW